MYSTQSFPQPNNLFPRDNLDPFCPKPFFHLPFNLLSRFSSVVVRGVRPREKSDLESRGERTIAGRLDAALALDPKGDDMLDAGRLELGSEVGVRFKSVAC
jgi:hypothetical protein